jgi:hypothetical protein
MKEALTVKVIARGKNGVWVRVPKRFGPRILTLPSDALPGVQPGQWVKAIVGELYLDGYGRYTATMEVTT